MTKKRIQTYVTPKTLEWLEAKADERQTSLSKVVTHIILTVMQGEIDINPLGLHISHASDSTYVTRSELKTLLEELFSSFYDAGFSEGVSRDGIWVSKSAISHIVSSQKAQPKNPTRKTSKGFGQ